MVDACTQYALTTCLTHVCACIYVCLACRRAGATGGYVVYVYTEIHRSGKMGVNHIIYTVVYTYL